MLPLLFFVLGFFVSSVGPGAVPGTALVIPLVLALGARSNLPPLLTALMVANGANAGNLSPLSAVGIIANSRMAAAGITRHEWKVMLANFLVHALVAAAAYVFYLRRLDARAPTEDTTHTPLAPLDRAQRLTLVTLAMWIACVVGFQLQVGLSPFAAALVLVVLRACDDSAAIAKMLWSVIAMVCGMAVLISILESSGGMKLFKQLLAAIATPHTVNGVIALVTGVNSSYSQRPSSLAAPVLQNVRLGPSDDPRRRRAVSAVRKYPRSRLDTRSEVRASACGPRGSEAHRLHRHGS